MKKSKKNRRRSFRVTVVIPEGVSVAEMREYIREAVRMWCKSFDPENDPLFDLDYNSVRVVALPQAKAV